MFRFLFLVLLFGCSTYEVNVPPSSGNELGTIERECRAFNSYECPGVVLKSGAIDGNSVAARLVHGIQKPLPAFDFAGSEWTSNLLSRSPFQGATVLQVVSKTSLTLEWSPDPLWFAGNRNGQMKFVHSPDKDDDIYVVLVARPMEEQDAGADGYDSVWSIYSVGVVTRSEPNTPFTNWLRPIPLTIEGRGMWTVVKFFSPAIRYDAAFASTGERPDAGR